MIRLSNRALDNLFKTGCLGTAYLFSFFALEARVPAFWNFEEVDSGIVGESFSRDYLEMTLVNGAATVFDGERDSMVLELDPSNLDYATIPNSDFLNPKHEITIAFWAFATDLEFETHLLQKGNASSQYRLLHRNGFLFFDLGGDNVRTAIFPLNTWTHLAFTYDGEKMSIYYNGELQDSDDKSGEIPTSSSALNFGNSILANTDPNLHFGGKLDDLLILPYALSVEELEYLIDQGPIKRWNFNESSGIIATSTGSGDPIVASLLLGATFDPVNKMEGAASLSLDAEFSQFLEIPSAPALTAPSGSFSFSTWIYPNTWTGSSALFQRGRDYTQFSLGQSGDRLLLRSGGSELEADLPETESWTHMMFSLSDTAITLVLNGERFALDGDNFEIPELNPLDDTIWVGSSSPFSPYPALHFNGRVDSLAFFPHGLAEGDYPVLSRTGLSSFSNMAPIALRQTVPTPENTPVDFSFTGRDPDLDPIRFEKLSDPSHGILSGTIPNFTYTPDPGFAGRDFIQFKASDGWAESNTEEVIIQVIDSANQTVTFDQSFTMDEDQSQEIVLTANDIDGDPLSFTIEEPPQHGTLNGTPPSVTYIPDPDYNGSDSFTFSANDSDPSVVTFTINPVNDAPVGTDDFVNVPVNDPIVVDILSNDYDADQDDMEITLITSGNVGTAEIIDGKITYTAGPDFNYGDTISYQLSDGVLTSEVTSLFIRPPDIFPITHFGAVGAAGVDDTEAIQNALDAAGEYAASNGSASLFIPNGTWMITPRGFVEGSIHRKDSGSWTNLGNITPGLTHGIWSFGEEPPEDSNGENGDRYLNINTGRLFERIDDSWVPENVLIVDNAGNGWVGGFEAPTAGIGNEGDYYFDFHIRFETFGEQCLTLTQAHNNVTIEGESRENAIISAYAWGGIDPMDYEVVLPEPSLPNPLTSGVIYSRLPRDHDGYYVRGTPFVFKNDGLDNFENVTFQNFTMKGNTTFNGKHGWTNNYFRLEEWDVTHKGITFTFGGAPMDNIVVQNCTLEGFRGEVLYKGGESIAEVDILNCIIRQSNSSSISISGAVTVEDCFIEEVYNGTENYASSPGQFTEVRNTTFKDIPDEGYGIVYIGEFDETTHLIATGNTFINAGFAGVFLSETAFDVTVSDNQFINTPKGVYFIHIGQYPGVAANVNDLTISNNNFLVSEENMNGVFVSAFLGSIPAKNWLIEGNTLEKEGDGNISSLVQAEHPGPKDLRSGFIVQNNILNAGVPVAGNPQSSSNGIRPVLINNSVAAQASANFNTNADPNTPFVVYPRWGKVRINFVQVDNKLVEVGDMDKYPVNFAFNLVNQNVTKGIELEPDPNWNNFTRGYMLYDDASIDLVFNSDGVFEVDETQNGYTPRSGTPSTVVTGSLIAFIGYESVTLNPAAPTIYDDFSGIPENVDVTIHFNANVTFENNSRIETHTGSAWAPGFDGSIVGSKQNDVFILQGDTIQP